MIAVSIPTTTDRSAGSAEAMKKYKNIFPPGWDEQRVREVLDHYENQNEEEAAAGDEEFAEPAAAPDRQNPPRSEAMAAMTAKQKVQQLLDRLPDDVSLEQIRYHVYVLHKIEQGQRDLEEGRVMSHEEVERRMRQWLDKQAGLENPEDP